MDVQLKRELQDFAFQIRIACMEEFKSLGFGHLGGSLSIVDTLAVLYGSVMNIRPDDPNWPDRDKFVSSKGHAGPAIYATLALKGYFPKELLATLNKPGTSLPSHCDHNKTPGIDMTTGSLGQGSSMAVGLALGDRYKGRNTRVFLMTGDGELNEGQVWEAAMLASARKLDNLVWFVDENKKQLDGETAAILPQGDIAAKFQAFGFHTQRIPGNDIEAIYEAIEKANGVKDMPHAIVLDTIKGAGVKSIEETASNHSIAAKPEAFDEWLAQLNRDYQAFLAQS
ncbi:transketolase [Christensenellaceae bacterium OttesenSCG-928-L17]|nr:transketolase [Christensenellaceae bacterium OttesenSCG-928-L17]